MNKNFLQICRMRDLLIAGKITVFKTLAISKNSASCISENNSKFSYTRIKQNSTIIYMENSQS